MRKVLRLPVTLFSVFILMLFAAAASAAPTVQIQSEVRCADEALRCAWVSVDITNPSAKPVSGQLVLTDWGYRSDAQKATFDVAEIGPGEVRNINLAVPFSGTSTGNFHDSEGNNLTINLNSYNSFMDERRTLFVFKGSNRLTDDEMDDFTRRGGISATSYTGGGMGGMTIKTGGGYTSRSLTASERSITQVSVDEMPENWACFVPLRHIIISQDALKSLTVPQRQALDQWTSLGGNQIIFDSDELNEQQVERGWVISERKNPVTNPEFEIKSVGEVFPLGKQIGGVPMPFQGKKTGGRIGALILATLFLIIAGPLNYYYFSKRGQIRKLIVTVPVISMAFCSLIIGYFILTQGFSRKGGSMSITTLNEDTNQAITFASHSLLSGLYPSGGFHFDSHTYLNSFQDQAASNMEVDLTREIHVTDGMFQPGRALDYLTILPHSTRERMIYDRGKGELRNGFEMPVKAVAVLDKGQYYVGGAAASGAISSLKALDGARKPEAESKGAALMSLVRYMGEQRLDTDELASVVELTGKVTDYPQEISGTIYAAILDGVPPGSESGVKITDGTNLHVIIGRVAGKGESQ